MRILRQADSGSTAPEESHFTGDVWITRGDAGDDPPMVTYLVTFSPGARTDWHVHPGGQTLHVVSGRGIVGNRSGARDTFVSGDIVLAQPGEEHWHGAAADHPMAHLSITLEPTEWFDEPVDDGTYEGR